MALERREWIGIRWRWRRERRLLIERDAYKEGHAIFIAFQLSYTLVKTRLCASIYGDTDAILVGVIIGREDS